MLLAPAMRAMSCSLVSAALRLLLGSASTCGVQTPGMASGHLSTDVARPQHDAHRARRVGSARGKVEQAGENRHVLLALRRP